MSTGTTRINPYFTSNRTSTRAPIASQKATPLRFQKQGSPASHFSDTQSYKVTTPLH